MLKSKVRRFRALTSCLRTLDAQRLLSCMAIILLVFGAVSTAVAAPVMFGANPNSKIFFGIDPTTGNTTDINTATVPGITALAWLPATHQLLGSDGAAKTFFTIDPATGITTLINSLTTRGIYSMTCDSVTSKLYGGDGSGKHFFSINPTTGATTDIGSTTTWQTLSLAYDSANDTIYGEPTRSTGRHCSSVL